MRGDAALEPLRVRALGSETQPVPGATVQWTVTEGEATLEPVQSVSDATGEAESRFTAGATLGTVKVSAAVQRTTPVAFTVTTLDPCIWMKRLQLETTASGIIRRLDCPDESGLFWDLYAFTVLTPQAVTIRTQSDNFDTRSWLLNYNGVRFVGRAGMIDSTDVNHEAAVKVILAPGDYLAGASSFRVGTTGPYELRVSGTSAESRSCDDEVWVVRGLTTEQQLTPTDCVDSSGRFYRDAFSLILWAGESVSFTQTSSQFRPRLRLLRRSGAVLAEANGDVAGAATIDFIADVTRGEYIVVASSVSPQRSGAYNLTVTEPTGGEAGATRVSEAWSSGHLGGMLTRLIFGGPPPGWKP